MHKTKTDIVLTPFLNQKRLQKITKQFNTCNIDYHPILKLNKINTVENLKKQLERFECLVFTSFNAIDFFFHEKTFIELLKNKIIIVASIKAKEKIKSKNKNIKVMYTPGYLGQEAVLQTIRTLPTTQTILYLCSNKASPYLLSTLKNENYNVRREDIYQANVNPLSQDYFDKKYSENENYFTEQNFLFASPYALQCFSKICLGFGVGHKYVNIICFGFSTYEEAKRQKFKLFYSHTAQTFEWCLLNYLSEA